MTQAPNAGPGGPKAGQAGEFRVVDDAEANPLEQQAKLLDPLSALNKLADGEDPVPAEAAPTAADGAAGAGGGAAPADVADPAGPPRAGPSSAVPLAGRRRTFSPATMVHGTKYKRFMVPLLLVVAGLLVLVGGASAFMLVSEKNTDQDSMLLTAILCASVPLAAGLAFGAWVFHRDVRRNA